MTCNCIETVNQKLLEAGKNTAISVPLFFAFEGEKTRGPCCVIETKKANDKVREKPSSIFATFCPFCGIKYDQDDTDVKAQS